MPGDLRHKEADRSLATQLTQAEFDKITAHNLDAQATGDIIYAASATQLEGLAAGSAGHVLTMGASIPTWAAAAAAAHAASHQDAGGDEVSVVGLSGLLADDQHVLDAEVQAIKLDDFTTPDDNTDLDASGAKHGLMPKADASKLGGIAAGADVTGSNAPQAHAASHQSGGGDSIKLDDLATPDDNTDLDFGTATHGLVPKGLDAGDFLRDDGTWAAAGADYPMKLKPAVVRWVLPGWGGKRGTGWVGGGKIYYIPIFVEETTTYIRIGVYVATAASGSADLRIFGWTDGLPDALVLNAGTVDTGTTGAKEITISQELTRGYYFLALRCTAGPELRGIDLDKAAWAPISGMNAQVGGAPSNVILDVTGAHTDPARAPDGSTTVQFAMVRLREN